MSKFKIQNIENNSIIEIIAMNIDDVNNILIKENRKASIISISEFKDMILGSLNGDKATHIILD
jgi:hypothetical protein